MAKTTYTPEFKSKLALELLQRNKQLGELAAEHSLDPDMLRNRCSEFAGNTSRVFDESRREKELKRKEQMLESEKAELCKTIGQLAVKRNFLRQCGERYIGADFEEKHRRKRAELSIERRRRLPGFPKSSYYYEAPQPTADEITLKEAVMNETDYWYSRQPAMGVRRLRSKLREKGLRTGCKLIKRYMKEMGIYALYPKPNLSKRNMEHKIYPYLLRNMHIFLPNQVWAIDITYIKIWYYLVCNEL